MTPGTVTPQFQAIAPLLTEGYAPKYVTEILTPSVADALDTQPTTDKDMLYAKLLHPYYGLKLYYSRYAFSRRGKEKFTLANIAIAALNEITSPDQIDHALAERNGDAIWNAFESRCHQGGIKPSPDQNEGTVAGMFELAQEVFRIDGIGSISRWILLSLQQTRRIESQFMRVVDVRGVGPKIASTYLRDLIWFADAEQSLDPIDQLYVQPIDSTVRAFATQTIKELEDRKVADWVVAGKIGKYARLSGISGIQLNMGLSYLGILCARNGTSFERELRSLTGAQKKEA